MALSDYMIPEESGVGLGFYAVWGIPFVFGLTLLPLQGLQIIRGGSLEQGSVLISVSLTLAMFFAVTFIVLILAILDRNLFPGSVFGNILPTLQNDIFDMSTSFAIGYGFWRGLQLLKGSDIFSTLSAFIPTLPPFSLLSTSSTSLDVSQSAFVNVMVVPYVEELFFGIALPLIIVIFLSELGLLRNAVALVIGLGLIPAALFASFHVQAATFSAFWVTAFIFRAILQSAVFIDFEFDFLPDVALMLPFIMGAHYANNITQFGGEISVLSQILFNEARGLNGFIQLGSDVVMGNVAAVDGSYLLFGLSVLPFAFTLLFVAVNIDRRFDVL